MPGIRRAFACVQAKLYDAAIAAQADRALAQKVHNEQTERIKESCKDHELAKDVELKGEAVLHHPRMQKQNVPAATDLICAACETSIEGTMGYAAAMRSPAGEHAFCQQAHVVMAHRVDDAGMIQSSTVLSSLFCIAAA